MLYVGLPASVIRRCGPNPSRASQSGNPASRGAYTARPLIISLIVQTIRRVPSRSDQIDAETRLRIWR
jgi:hypothetical protein